MTFPGIHPASARPRLDKEWLLGFCPTLPG